MPESCPRSSGGRDGRGSRVAATVVVGYIPGPIGEAALTAGVAEARQRDLALVVVNTTRGDALVDQRYLASPDAEALRARLDTLDVTAELRQVSAGRDIAEDLDLIAEEVDAELVVIGLRQRTPVGKLILGSAASRILLGVRRPVLTVKP